MDECNCCRTKERSAGDKQALLNRLARIEGQIRGIRKMVEEDAYCIDIINQISAATGGLTSLNKLILEEHIKTCVAEDVRDGKTDKLDELTLTLRKLMN
ncbi:DNA-binding transcriptional regulator, FrmR family [Ruminococcaceae bacterium YRB3002]|nr:DNA-binding transcriptional regulator, FrmR family [Ruminococcaceae bacterium YRB3002]